MKEVGRDTGFLVVEIDLSEREYVGRCDEVRGGRIPEEDPETLVLKEAVEGGLGRVFFAGDGFTRPEGFEGDGKADFCSEPEGAGSLEVGSLEDENFGIPDDLKGVAEVD